MAKKLEYQIILDNGDAVRKTHDLNQGLEQTDKKANAAGQQTNNLSGSLGNMVAQMAGAVGGIRMAIQALEEFNKVQREGEERSIAFGKTLAQIALARGGIRGARSAARDVTLGTGATMEEAAALIDQAEDLGFKGQEAVDAARSAALGANVLGMGRSASEVLDVGGQIARSQGTDIGTALGKVRAVGDRAVSRETAVALQVGQGIGVSADQTLALIKGLTESGQGGRQSTSNALQFLMQLQAANFKGGDLEEGLSFLKRRGVNVGRVAAGFENFGGNLADIEAATAGDMLSASNVALRNDSELRNIIAVNSAKQQADYERQSKANTERALARAEMDQRAAGSGYAAETLNNLNNRINPFAEMGNIDRWNKDRASERAQMRMVKAVRETADNTRPPQSNPTTVPREE